MNKPSIAILTEPVPNYADRPIYAFLRNLKHKIYNIKKQTGGHFAVTRSLLRGLKLNKVNYLYNEPIDYRLPENVLVLSGVDTLKFAIKLKKEGLIKKLYAGPNLVVHADDEECLVGSDEIEKLLIPSDWVRIAYEKECKKTKGKILIWPSGVNQDYWKPQLPNSKKSTIAIYYKLPKNNCNSRFLASVLSQVKENGFKSETIEYGNYTSEQYKNILEKSLAVIILGLWESQGLAMVEAWSMNVPTYVWDGGYDVIDNRKYDKISPAPYLTKKTGKFWKDESDLKKLLINTPSNKYSPRKWVLHNLTDEICAKNIYKYIFFDKPY